MESNKLTPLIIFIFCSAINKNLNYINYLYNRYIENKHNISNNEGVIKLNKYIKGIFKDLFK